MCIKTISHEAPWRFELLRYGAEEPNEKQDWNINCKMWNVGGKLWDVGLYFPRAYYSLSLQGLRVHLWIWLVAEWWVTISMYIKYEVIAEF